MVSAALVPTGCVVEVIVEQFSVGRNELCDNNGRRLDSTNFVDDGAAFLLRESNDSSLLIEFVTDSFSVLSSPSLSLLVSSSSSSLPSSVSCTCWRHKLCSELKWLSSSTTWECAVV